MNKADAKSLHKLLESRYTPYLVGDFTKPVKYQTCNHRKVSTEFGTTLDYCGMYSADCINRVTNGREPIWYRPKE